MKVEPKYRATPEEIGRLRRQIREQAQRTDGCVDYNVFLKAATLDDHCWMWLRQRMRPAELKLLDEMIKREGTAS